jgi:hypothetical protein
MTTHGLHRSASGPGKNIRAQAGEKVFRKEVIAG